MYHLTALYLGETVARVDYPDSILVSVHTESEARALRTILQHQGYEVGVLKSVTREHLIVSSDKAWL